jgi:uncharacterized protein YbbC (DUF1343 family)
MFCGLDQLFGGDLSAARRRIRSARSGLLTHAAAVDRRGRSALEAMEELGASPAVIFTPEHGFDGVAQAEEPVATREAPRSAPPAARPEPSRELGDEGTPELTVPDASLEGGPEEMPRHDSGWPPPLVSLYGATRESLTPSAERLAGLDLLVIDLCDVGSRYYTYVWTALLAARAAQAAGIHTLVLDRPNPVSGDPSFLEGAPQQDGYCSFVGLEPIPIRHCLTLGEIVTHFFAQAGLPLGADGALSVVPTRGWERFQTALAWGRPFVMPSPNMPTCETALVYPGGCLLEGTNLSEGRGTAAPFQLVGAPFLDGQALAQALRDRGTPGALVRPVSFRPTFGKHAGEQCNGVMLHVGDWRMFRPVATYLGLIALARAQAPEQFEFLTRAYEFETEKPAFDLLAGSDAPRKAILDGARPDDVISTIGVVDKSWSDLVRDVEGLLGRARA